MLFCNINLFDDEFDYHENQYVGVKDGVIAYIGAEEPKEDFGERYDGRRKLLMCGMYNTHAHVPMTLLRGYAEDLPLDRWLNEMVFPFEAKITEESAYPATLLGIAEMLRFGTVSFSDMYYFTDARARAVIESGIKCNMCNGLIEFRDIPYHETKAFAADEHLIKEYHQAADGRLKAEMCLHAEYTTTPTIVRTVAESARERGLGLQVHISETRKEHEECKQRHEGRTPVQYFCDLGVFEVPVTAAHCVWLEGEDFDILREKNATVASCPASNMKLGSGFANEQEFYERGVRVALGTDGVASNNNHNMFKDMYLFSIVCRGVTLNPVGITPRNALKIATRNGAYAQRRSLCGALQVGYAADLIVLDIDVPWMHPVTEMRRNVVFSAQGSDVCLTMVDGKVLYRDGEYLTIDVEKATFETQKYRDLIVASL